MVLAAELGTLAVEQAFALGLEPGLVETARNGIDLDAEGRHCESVNDIGRGGGHENANRLVDRQNQLVVDGQKTRIDRLVFLAGGCAVLILQEERIEGERI